MKRVIETMVKYKYIMYPLCITANLYGAFNSNLFSMFAIGWCSALLFAELVRDELI